MENNQNDYNRKIQLLELADKIHNISKACKELGYSRDSYYRFKKLNESGGKEALKENKRKIPKLKNRVTQNIEEAVIKLAFSNPELGKKRVKKELEKIGINVSPNTVKNIWIRNDLETYQKRYQKLKKNNKPTKEQEKLFKIFNNKEYNKELFLSFQNKTSYPGQIGIQDSLFVNNLKGIGRIYQQTFLDIYSGVAIIKLYKSINPQNSKDFLINSVIPIYERSSIKLIEIHTDNRKEYSNTTYLRYLHDNQIRHQNMFRNKNSLMKHFHELIKTNFYTKAFAKKKYKNINDLQKDVDKWLNKYHEKIYLSS